MPQINYLKLSAFISFSLYTITSFGGVSFTPKSGDYVPQITITDEIRKEDLLNFMTFAQMARADGLYQIILNSSGGDVETALSMGKVIRIDRASVSVPDGATCLSSCVFILASGVIRYVGGVVGIHRPFAIDDTDTDFKSQKRKYSKLEKDIKLYLKAMNIPVSLYDDMFRIPPHKIVLLSKEELRNYGLNEDDPYEDAARIAAVAKILGISSKELIQRQALANAKCNTGIPEKDAKCYDQVIKRGK